MAARKVSIAKLKKKLDLVFSAYIRRRDTREDGTFVCISSGRTLPADEMDAGHFYARTFTATRWDERNVNGQSRQDNRFKHGALLDYRKGILAKYGQKTLDELEELHNKPVKLDRQWLEERIEHYKELLNP